MYKLVSVSNKHNIEKLCSFFIQNGDKILTTGGTYNYLIDKLPQHKNSIVKVSDITEYPEILNGRVKTLHPKIFGGLLCKYDNDSHNQEVDKHNIPKINGVVVNLYPFSETVKKHKDNLDNLNNLDNQVDKEQHNDIIENIDIGGVSLIRAAAKNYEHVITITDPEDYKYIMEHERN